MKIPFLSRLFKNSGFTKPDRWMIDAFGGTPTHAGVTVNELTAMQSSAVFACVRVLAETVASLPLPVYQRLPSGGKTRAPTHVLYPVLHDIANPEMTSFLFRETMMVHLGLWGNAYAEIEYDAGGRVRALWPITPNRVVVARNEQTNELQYTVTLPEGLTKTFPAWKIFHIPGIGFNGLVGMSPITAARQAIGLAVATETFGAKFFGNGTNIGGIAKHPGKLSEQGSKNLRASINEAYTGLGNSHRLMLLEEGMDFEKIGIPPEDAQFLETRKFQLNDIARFYRIPPHMIGDLERATFSNVEQQSIDFVVHTIRPWLVRWEQSINMKLFPEHERKSYYAEHLVDGLLRGDIKSRYEAYAVGRQNGWLSANDIREMENMNPIDGGDVYLVNGNMVPASHAGKGGENE